MLSRPFASQIQVTRLLGRTPCASRAKGGSKVASVESQPRQGVGQVVLATLHSRLGFALLQCKWQRLSR